MGHRTSSAGLQVVVLTKLLQRANQDHVAGGGWEIEIPQVEKERKLLGNIILTVRRRSFSQSRKVFHRSGLLDAAL